MSQWLKIEVDMQGEVLNGKKMLLQNSIKVNQLFLLLFYHLKIIVFKLFKFYL
jgi:hypothetical protein